MKKLQSDILDALEKIEASSKSNRRSKATAADRSTKPKQEVQPPNAMEKKITCNSSFKEELDSVASLDDTRDNMKPRKIEFGTLATMEWSDKQVKNHESHRVAAEGEPKEQEKSSVLASINPQRLPKINTEQKKHSDPLIEANKTIDKHSLLSNNDALVEIGSKASNPSALAPER